MTSSSKCLPFGNEFCTGNSFLCTLTVTVLPCLHLLCAWFSFCRYSLFLNLRKQIFFWEIMKTTSYFVYANGFFVSFQLMGTSPNGSNYNRYFEQDKNNVKQFYIVLVQKTKFMPHRQLLFLCLVSQIKNHLLFSPKFELVT